MAETVRRDAARAKRYRSDHWGSDLAAFDTGSSAHINLRYACAHLFLLILQVRLLRAFNKVLMRPPGERASSSAASHLHT